MEQTRISFNVPGLIYHLGCGIVLCIHVGHLLNNLGGTDKRTLLSVKKLRVLPGLLMHSIPRLFRVRHLLPNGRSKERKNDIWEFHWIFGIKIQRPVYSFFCIPLKVLRFTVEVLETVSTIAVFPPERGQKFVWYFQL